MSQNTTLVMGASANPERYSNLAIKRLSAHGEHVIALGNKEGTVDGISIQRGQPALENIDTVTLYLNAQNQKQYYGYIFSLHPRRIIFNPGAENTELYEMARKEGIQTMEACTLVLLSTGQY